MKPVRFFLISLMLLLFLRTIFVWYGFDRMPLLSNNDEAVFNDPAISMMRGTGLVAKSYSGIMDMDTVFGHFPPLYIAVQSAVFGMAGISPLSLRGLNIVFFILYVLLFALLVFRFRAMGIYDPYAALWVMALLLSDPTGFSFCRMGRPESLAIFFALSAFLALTAPSGITARRRHWVFSGLLIGCAIAVHLEMVTSLVIYVILAFLKFFKRDKKVLLALLVLPFGVLACIWVGAHGTKSLAALAQFRRMYSCSSGGFLRGYRIFDLVRMMAAKNFQAFNGAGGFAMILVGFSWVAIAIRFLHGLTQRSVRANQGYRCLLFMGAVAVIHFIMIDRFFGSATQRIITILPPALMGLGVALSHLRLSKAGRWVLNGILGFLLLAGLTGHAVYLRKIHREWDERDPSRFSAFVSELPQNKRIAAAFPLWFELIKSGHDIFVLGSGAPCHVDSAATIDLNSMDMMVLYSDDVFFSPQDVTGWDKEEMIVGARGFIIFRKTGFSKTP